MRNFIIFSFLDAFINVMVVIVDQLKALAETINTLSSTIRTKWCDQPFKARNKFKSTESGSYGTYFRLSAGLGVKIVSGSWDYGNTAKEFDMLRKARERFGDAVPRPYCMITLPFVQQSFLFMEHVDGDTFSDLDLSFNESDDFKKIRAMVEGSDLQHGDMHSGNVMMTKDGKVKVIDWGCAYLIEQPKEQVTLQQVG